MSYAFKDYHWSKDISITEYLQPLSVEEALEMLAKYNGKAQVIAGGTDVIPQMRHRDLDVEVLVDITRLPDMDRIVEESGRIVIGGLVTHSQIASSALIREKAGIFADGAGCLGSPQIRNIATVAGNLISGHPAADTSTPLLALNASVTVTSQKGDRVIPLTEFFIDKGRTALDSRREILKQISFAPLKKNQGGGHLRLSKRRSLTVAVLIFAAVVEVDAAQNMIRDAQIALGPVAPTPLRASKTEAMLRGAAINKETIEKAAESVCRESNPIADPVWGSIEYKEAIIKVFTKRGLKRALKQAGTPVE